MRRRFSVSGILSTDEVVRYLSHELFTMSVSVKWTTLDQSGQDAYRHKSNKNKHLRQTKQPNTTLPNLHERDKRSRTPDCFDEEEERG